MLLTVLECSKNEFLFYDTSIKSNTNLGEPCPKELGASVGTLCFLNEEA